MNAEKCLKMLREIKDVSFATVDENGAPQVRIIDVMLVDGGALYFCTSRGKDFHAQLMRDGRVAVTGLNKNWQMVRLNGRTRRLENSREWIDRIFAANPSMNSVYPGTEPINRESFTLGSAKAKPKGFFITDRCIGCGICAANCPQQCISEGAPYVIAQEHCLHCGLCHENCPAGAVVRREETE